MNSDRLPSWTIRFCCQSGKNTAFSNHHLHPPSTRCTYDASVHPEATVATTPHDQITLSIILILINPSHHLMIRNCPTRMLSTTWSIHSSLNMRSRMGSWVIDRLGHLRGVRPVIRAVSLIRRMALWDLRWRRRASIIAIFIGIF